MSTSSSDANGSTHYEVLGLRRTASGDEIRRAYLARARAHHPDFHTMASPEERRRNEREMQVVNEAWAVLGDPSRRRLYDRQLDGIGATGGSESTVPGPVPGRYDFVPLDDEDIDYAELLDDTPTDAVPMERSVQVAPVLAVLVGMGLLVVGALVGLGFVMVFGAILAAVGVLGFLAAPALAISRSLQAERDL